MWLRVIGVCCLLVFTSGCWTDDPTRNNTFIPLTSIAIIPAYVSMADKTVNQYKAIGDFSGSFTRDITREVAWRIANKKVARVSTEAGSEGLVTALSPGETSVTALYGGISGEAPVVVTSAFLTSIEIAPQDAELQKNVTRQYTATGTFSDASMQDITLLTAWESSATDIATINDAGLATAHAVGSATIIGTWQGISSSATLLVTGAALTAIAIDPEEATIARGTVAQLQAEGTYSDSSTLDLTDVVDWESSDPDVARVNTAGLVEGVAPGTAEVRASFAGEGGTIEAAAQITVTGAFIEFISLAPANTIITEGESQQFTATATFSDGSEQEITSLATWLTIDNSVGTISNSPDSRGLFVSINPGSTSIEATFGGVTGETSVIVRR